MFILQLSSVVVMMMMVVVMMMIVVIMINRFSRGVVVEEFDERVQVTTSFVLLGISLVVGREEDDGWESFD